MGLGNLSAFERQWQNLMESGAWSEEFKISLVAAHSIEDFTVSGVFYSGTFGEDSPAQPYAPKKAVRREEFCISANSLPVSVTDPKRMLQGATIVSPTRGAYKVYEVRGEKSGTLGLLLNPTEVPANSGGNNG